MKYLYLKSSKTVHIEVDGIYVSQLTLCGANRGLNRIIGNLAPKRFKRTKVWPVGTKHLCKTCKKILDNK